MRPFYLIIVFVLILGRVAGADVSDIAGPGIVTGLVKSSGGEEIEYATVVFTDKAGEYVAGATTAEGGSFSVAVADGDYVVEVSFVGYKTLRRDVTVSGTVDMGDIVLEPEALEVDEVVVRGRAVTHRADGYSLALGDSKIAEGRNAREALRYVPGLWIDSNEDIKINGQGGVQVMINERIVTMSSGELLRYLEGISAEDVKSIDVVRSAGAKYDAAVGGAVLKINLRNRKMNGVFGNVSMAYERTDTMDLKYAPSVWVNVMHKKLSLSTGFSYSNTRYSEHIDMDTYFRQSGDTLTALYSALNKHRSMTYDIRGVYRFDDRNSIGLDYHLGNYRYSYDNVSDGVITRRELFTRMSTFAPNGRSDNHDLSFNYRRQLDTLGSDLLVVGDYHYAATDAKSYTTTADYMPGSSLFGYVYDKSDIRNHFYTARIDVNKQFNKKWSLGYGAKYSYSTLSSIYDYYTSSDNHSWAHDADYSDHYRYREGVAAAYATTSADLGRWNITAGVRVENTDMRPKSLKESESHHRNYTDIFPSAAVSYAINPQKQYLVALNYRRSISRPGFSMLDPSRVKVDNVTVSVGNPYLQSSYAENLSLNFTLAGKYMFTANYSYRNKAFERVMLPDADNPDMILLTYRNYDNDNSFMFNTYLPFSPFKWWDVSLDGTTGPMSTTISGVKRTHWFYQGSVNTIFSLPKKWVIELNGHCLGNALQGNMLLYRPEAGMDGSLKKSFLDGRLSLVLNVRNIVSTGTYIKIEESDYSKHAYSRSTYDSARRYGITLRYNFKAGKDFSAAHVVKGNAEDAGRF